MISRLIDFALVVLKLLMLKNCGIIEISQIKFLNFSGTERVKKTTEKIEKRSKPSKIVRQPLFKQFNHLQILIHVTLFKRFH